MFDGRAAVNEGVWDAIAVVATPGTLVTGLIIAAFILGARPLSPHRYIAAAMRVAALLTALTALTIAVHSNGWVTRLDTATTSWLVAHRSVGFDVAASVITDLGSPIATAAAGAIFAALLCWRARSTIPGIIVIGTVSAAALASTVLKVVVDRPRPPLQWQIVRETDPSFPSGHVTGTAALLGIIAFCVGTACSRTVRAWLASGVITAVAVIAATRLYLGVHWLSDVAAGAILAAVFVTIGATVLGALPAGSGQHGVPRAAPSPGEATGDDVLRRAREPRHRIAADRDGARCVSPRDIGEPHLERKP
jgi:undecaprenyl-diphosphatase